jgi:hypothetical protein
MIPDPAVSLDDAGRADLLRLLLPVVHDVNAALIHPPAVARHDWLGPASDRCRELETELRGRLVQVLGELDRALAAIRSTS